MSARRSPWLYILSAVLLCALPLVCNAYWLDVCVSIGLYALLALSLNVILGQAGIFHMGHAAFFAVGAYATAILNTVYHWPVLWVRPPLWWPWWWPVPSFICGATTCLL